MNFVFLIEKHFDFIGVFDARTGKETQRTSWCHSNEGAIHFLVLLLQFLILLIKNFKFKVCMEIKVNFQS